MNLCGGIANITEPEQLLLEIPDEKFQMTPRRKAASSMPSRRRKDDLGPIDTERRNPSERRSSARPLSARSRGRSSQSPMADPSPTFLNPISKDDLKKSMTRQRPAGPPVHVSKSVSGLLKKLETGYNVTMLRDDGGKRMVLLDVNTDRVYLRVRTRDENSGDNENDGFKSNFSQILLKVTDITRLEVGREKSTKKSGSSPKQVTSFSIVLRKPVGKSSTFNFEAESPVERDSIIGGIKSVLELTKLPSESRRRRSLHDARSKNSQTSSSKEVTKENGTFKSTTNKKDDDIAGSAAVYFDFDLPNDGPEAAIEAEVRSDTGERGSDDDREGPPSHSGHERRARKEKRNNDANEFAITVIENPVDRRKTSIEVAGLNWSVDDIFCGAIGGGDSTPGATSPANNERSLQGKFGEQIMCNPLDGCNAQALAAVDDVELTAIGANDVSAGPFCTDDVCTATLKDFTDTMKGIFEIKQHSREGQPNNEKQRVMAEDYIANVLGAPTTVAANLLSVTDMWTAIPEKPPAPKKKILQNRSRNNGAQATRLARLRRQMTFQFAESSEKMPFVQVVSSYDDVERGGRFGKKLTSGLIAKGHQNDSSQFLRAVVNNMELHDSHDEEILYYDSDPEDVREIALKRGPRRAIAELENASKTAKPRREALSDIPMSRLNLSRRLRRADDDIVNEIIDAMKNEEMTLLWHPSQKDTPNRAPFCSKVWIESGIYLIDGTFLLPKLTWVPVFEQNIQSKVLNVTLSNPGTIDLLDVCRVRECGKIDRKIHPFANLDCSFVVQTQKEVQLFEARSKEERTRIVNGLRLVIARLASLLMLRDLRAVDEFFGGNSVPGEAPAWAQGKNESSDASE